MLTKNNCKASGVLALAAIAALGTGELHAQGMREPLLLTATNGSTNYLAVINTRTQDISYIPTGGSGGVSPGSNAGGVAVMGELAAVVNFGSSNVTIFARQGNSMTPVQMIPTASQPVSVAFGHDHLVVLGQTTAESFPMSGMPTLGMPVSGAPASGAPTPGTTIAMKHDGVVSLLKGDGTAGQIVTFETGAMYSETSGDIGMINFGVPGLAGPSIPVPLPAAPNNNTPLGMIGRGANVYVTIAHSDIEALVVNGKIVSTAVGPTPFMDSSGNLLHAPCWNALSGQFLFSSDSPGKQLLRYLVSDSNIFYDKAGVAQLTGAPTDLDAQGSLLGVIDGGDGVNADVSLFDIDSEGELALRFALKIASPINGAAIIQ